MITVICGEFRYWILGLESGYESIGGIAYLHGVHSSPPHLIIPIATGTPTPSGVGVIIAPRMRNPCQAVYYQRGERRDMMPVKQSCINYRPSPNQMVLPSCVRYPLPLMAFLMIRRYGSLYTKYGKL